MGRERVAYHMRLIVTFNRISGNPCILAKPHGHRQLSNHVHILCALYFIAYILYLPCISTVPQDSPDFQHKV